MSGTGPRGAESGVVLVEVLAALSIVAVMSGLILGYFGQLGAVVRLQEEVALRTELAAAAEHLQRSVEAARAVPLVTAGETTPNMFEGAADRMRFVAVTRRGFRTPGFGEVRLAAEPAGPGQSVVQSVQPRRRETAGAIARAVVIDGLSAIRFEYADANGAFHDSWAGQTLPRAVRIGLGLRVDGRTVSVQAIARLR
jgi:type II secretory pathway pseudopilin PulG